MSDFDSVVDLVKVGMYKVILNVVSVDGLNVDLVIVLVNVVEGNEFLILFVFGFDFILDFMLNFNNLNINFNLDNG